jgi:hypothetical protein
MNTDFNGVPRIGSMKICFVGLDLEGGRSLRT